MNRTCPRSCPADLSLRLTDRLGPLSLDEPLPEGAHFIRLHQDCVWATARHPAPGTLRVLEGDVWITVEGEATDHVVRAGQSFPIRPAGKVVVQGLTDARLLVVPGLAA